MSTKSHPAVQAAYRAGLGPYDAGMVRDGDYTELSNGYRVQCSPAGGDHGTSNLAGGMVLKTDPEVKGAAVDLGIRFNDGKNLRAPDIAVGDVEATAGWATRMPPLCVEYAARGQDEGELQIKIGELLERGVRYVWVVRLEEPPSVEVYEEGKPMRVVHDGEELSAPGALANRYQVRELIDGEAANEATLRNLLNRKGHPSLDEALRRSREDGKDQGFKDGKAEGKAEDVLAVLQVRGLPVSTEDEQRIRACQDEALLSRWLVRAVTAANLAAVLDEPNP